MEVRRAAMAHGHDRQHSARPAHNFDRGPPQSRKRSTGIHRWEKSLHRFLEFLGGPEGDLLARLDLDRLARRRIAAHASGALADLKNSETVDAEPVPFLQVLRHQ